jgi:prepilin-type N-terminal cleavage/methylation domain-containing protein
MFNTVHRIQNKKNPQARRGQAGFTLIEMIVAVGLFAVVMLVSVGALLSLVTANRKAQGLQSVMNNMNVAIDGMVRAVRMGSSYDGSGQCSGNIDGQPKDCTGGSTQFSFEPYHNCSDPNTHCDGSGLVPRRIYWYDSVSKSIYRSDDGTLAGSAPITSPEVNINSVTFYVLGSASGDTQQPKVLIVIKGSAGSAQLVTSTTFHIQATAVQRILDL